MTDKELMQQALDALTAYDGTNGASQRKRVLAALRERLAQPNEFNPDWDAMAVMVEEQQRMAKRIAELEAQPEQEPVAVWELQEDGWDTICDGDWLQTLPVGTKLYTTPPQRKPEQEPVAWEDVLGAIARGWTHDDNKHKTMDVQLAVAIAKEIQDMVSAPPQRKPLTPREIELLEGMIEVQLHHAAQCDLIANRVMADKQKGWDMERVELLRKLKEKNT